MTPGPEVGRVYQNHRQEHSGFGGVVFHHEQRPHNSLIPEGLGEVVQHRGQQPAKHPWDVVQHHGQGLFATSTSMGLGGWVSITDRDPPRLHL